jgi:hypothetical protein
MFTSVEPVYRTVSCPTEIVEALNIRKRFIIVGNLVISFMLLDTGYRILVTGYWLQDTGYWLLVTGPARRPDSYRD